jgi:hypothetical protein
VNPGEAAQASSEIIKVRTLRSLVAQERSWNLVQCGEMQTEMAGGLRGVELRRGWISPVEWR